MTPSDLIPAAVREFGKICAALQRISLRELRRPEQNGEGAMLPCLYPAELFPGRFFPTASGTSG
jgi:hypothetical protein